MSDGEDWAPVLQQPVSPRNTTVCRLKGTKLYGPGQRRWSHFDEAGIT